MTLLNASIEELVSYREMARSAQYLSLIKRLNDDVAKSKDAVFNSITTPEELFRKREFFRGRASLIQELNELYKTADQEYQKKTKK